MYYRTAFTRPEGITTKEHEQCLVKNIRHTFFL